MKRNSYVSLESIETICKVLDCKVDDILEFVPDGVQDGGNDDGK
ncbi:MAG: helix-turn-helix transcriptional regulator [Prolixibacteraceae bacterium]|nr:helix-turn-helix transcriptional regulator [Prolixibacteraceae bacterium]